MKTCPVCGARCFDDMDVCYGCMHRFGPGGAAPAPQAATVFGQAANPVAHQSAPSDSSASSAPNAAAPPGQSAPAVSSAPPESAGSTASPAAPPVPSLAQGSMLEGGATPPCVPSPSVSCASASLPQTVATSVAACNPSSSGGATALGAARCEGVATSALATPCSAALGERAEPQARPTPDGVQRGPEKEALPAHNVAVTPGATVVSQPISFDEMKRGAMFQLVVTLRPCPPASAGEGA